jgi:TFIIF-interacting CTD phosphatase-like protein
MISSKQKNKKKHIVLDLDNTLIYSLPTDQYKPKKHRNRIKKFTFHNMDNDYIVFERPHLQQFLDYLFANYTVSIWTAASQNYALFIIDKIILKNKPNRKLEYILFSYHCDLSQNKTNCTKHLQMFHNKSPFKYTTNNTFIIDDFIEVFETQPKNCIRAHSFSFKNLSSEHDKYLLHLQKIMESYSRETSNFAIKINNELQNLYPFD